MGKRAALIDELVASIIVALIVRAIGVAGLELVAFEERSIRASGIPWLYFLLAAPIFLGIASYFLVKWSHGYKGPSELISLLKQKSSNFPGWVRATITWIISCIELGSGLSPKGFEGPYLAAAGGLSGFLATRLRLDAATRRRLARCGLGVAFGLLFRSPLGGLICTFEFGGFDKNEFRKLLLPAILATSVNIWFTHITRLPAPFEPLLSPSSITFQEFFLLILLGVFSGITGIVYVMAIRSAKKLFGRLEKYTPFIFIPVLGATISTVLGAFFPIILGSNDLSQVISFSSPVPFIILGAIFAKIIATASADGSKLAGGTVGPAILLGGLVGKFVGGMNPLFAAAGSAAVIGPVAGLSFTMLFTVVTWLDFSPIAWIVAVPLFLSKLLSWRIELYPYKHPVLQSSFQESSKLQKKRHKSFKVVV